MNCPKKVYNYFKEKSPKINQLNRKRVNKMDL